MDYSDIEEDEQDLRSETLSPSEDGPAEPVGNKRERLRAVLLPSIQSRVAALGGFEDVVVEQDVNEDEEKEGEPAVRTVRVYKLGDQVLGCLKDLKRFWRMDDHDDDRNVARIFYESGLLKNDLVHILNGAGLPESGGREEKAALASADLIAAMTWPIDPIEELREAELSGDKSSIDAINKVDYQSLLAAQREYKKNLLKHGAIKSLFRILAPRLGKSYRDRTNRDENVISLILHVFRNLAAIKDRAFSTYNSSESLEEANLQSELIVQLGSDNVFDLLITISSLAGKSDFNQWNVLVQEIFFLLFRGVDRPEHLVIQKEDVTKSIREDKLGKLLEQEATRKRLDGRKGVTRHSRFGTTVVIENGKDRIVMHKQAAVGEAAVNPGKLIDVTRKAKKLKVKAENDLAPPTELTPDALKVLQAVAMSFIESAFNRELESIIWYNTNGPIAAFFASLLKDIRMERPKVREIDHTRFLFLVRLFLEYFLALNAYERKQEIDPTSEDAHDFDLIAEMTEPTSLVYVCMRMKSCLADKPPSWTELHAATECFVQILLVIDALQHSGNEDYKEVSEILQNKLYYEKESLDIVLDVMRAYKQQPIKFLNSIIHLAHVLLRMLEKYAQNKDYMYVRKRAARRKKKGDDGDDGQEDDEEPSAKSYSEHAFEFESFQDRFAEPGCVKTLLTYLAGYKDFTTEDQMKRIVSLMHRIAVRAKSEGLFFRATSLELFRRIIDDRACLPKNAAYKDLSKFITYILRKFFKAAQEQPILLLEVFFTHRKSSIGKIIYGENSDVDDDDGPKKLRMPAEIEIKKSKGFSWSQQVGIAVSLLSNKGRDDLLTWIKETLSTLAKAREATIQEVDAKRIVDIQHMEPVDDEDTEEFEQRRMRLMAAGPSEEALAAVQPFEIPYEDTEVRDEFTKNSELKLLVRLLKWEDRESDDHTHLIWTVPPTVLPEDLFSQIKLIDDSLINPVDPEDGKPLADLVAKKYRSVKTRQQRADDGSDSDDDDVVFSDPEAAAAVGGSKKSKKRKGSSKNKGEGKGTQGGSKRKRRVEEAKIYRTAEFILDSDEDEEADRAFFEREAQLRKTMEEKSGLSRAPAKSKSKSRKGKKSEKAVKTRKGKKAKAARTSDASSDEENRKDQSSNADSDASSALPAKEPLKAIKARPKAKPAVKRVPATPGTEPSSSPLGTSGSKKRARSDSSAAGSVRSPLTASPDLAAGARKGRLVVDSDDEE